MKRVFLDTNILMDVAENREHAPEANLLLDFGMSGIVHVCVAPVTYTTMSFLLRRFGKERIHEILQQLSEGIEVLPMDEAQFQQAMSFGPVRDFEDMMQYQCALAGGCDVIITNDKKGFEERSTLPIMTATEFLQSLMEK